MVESGYTLEVREPLGESLLATMVQWDALEWTLDLNGYGYLTVMFGTEQFDVGLYEADRRLDLWRTDSLGVSRLIDSYWARGLRRETSEAGYSGIVLRGVGRNQLLERRIIAAASGSAEASKSGAADDVIKAYVREAMGALADADRDWTGNGLSVEPDSSEAVVLSKAASRRNLLTVLQEISDTAAETDERVFFGIEWVSSTEMIFRTRVGVWGVDRREMRTPFSLRRGTLADAMIDRDARDEVSFVYVAGQGQGSGRTVVEVEDAARIAASPWGRIERLADARQATTTATLEAIGYSALAEGRPVVRFDAILRDAPGSRYGLDWALGDVVRAEYENEVFDCVIQAVQGRVGDGEQLAARLEAGIG